MGCDGRLDVPSSNLDPKTDLDPDSSSPLSYLKYFPPSSYWIDVCEGGASIFIISETVMTFLLWFRIIQCSVGESGLVGYASLDPLALSSVRSWDFNFQAATFLDGVVDIPSRFGFDFGGILPEKQVLVTNNKETNRRNEEK